VRDGADDVIVGVRRELDGSAAEAAAGSARGRQAFGRLDAALATFLKEVQLAG
jgi:hypothetical protein